MWQNEREVVEGKGTYLRYGRVMFLKRVGWRRTNSFHSSMQILPSPSASASANVWRNRKMYKQQVRVQTFSYRPIAKENHTLEFWGQEINPKSYQCLCWLSAQMHTPYLLCDFINRLIQILASKRWKGTKKNWISSMLSKNYLVKDSLYKFIWQIQPRFR